MEKGEIYRMLDDEQVWNDAIPACRVEFVVLMSGKQYGREEILQAFHFFSAGFDAYERVNK